MPHLKYVMEVAIYRRSEGAFWGQFEQDKAKHMAWQMSRPGMSPCPPDNKMRIESRFHEDYPAPWRYNEAIGFIRIFVFWDQVRGELFLADGILEGRRHDRRSKKIYRDKDKVFELPVFRDQDNAGLCREIHDHLVAVGQGLRRKGVVVDLEAFDNIAPFVDWRGLMASVPT